MQNSKIRTPSILVPYQGADPTGATNDIFLYLRPETNGVAVESVLLRVIRSNPHYSANIKLVFMANYPGDYISQKHIIEHHYYHKIKFAEKGKKGFTKRMIAAFESFYGENFENAAVISPFEAMEKLKLSEEELFNIWVAPDDFMSIYGNTIKKYSGFYVINYDIPSLLHKNNFRTDIAVMLFRIYFSCQEFSQMISDMEMSLKEAGVINEKKPASRVFHYTKSPFEQIQDGLEYLYDAANKKGSGISFLCYLNRNGFENEKILHLIKNPVITAPFPDGERENTIFEFTKGMDYSGAAEFLKSVK